MTRVLSVITVCLVVMGLLGCDSGKSYKEANRANKSIFIKGKITKPVPDNGDHLIPKDKVALYKINPITNDAELLNKISPNKDRSFEFEVTVNEPDYYMIAVYGNLQQVNFLLHKSDINVVLEGVEDGFSEVTGCRDTDLMNEFLDIKRDISRKMKKMSREEFDIYRVKKAKEFIKKADKSLTMILGTNLLTPDDDWQDMKRVGDELSKLYPNSEHIKNYLTNLAKTQKLLIGQKAPSFRFKTSQGDTLRLEDWYGNYILVDFWSSQIPNINYDNIALTNIYKQYKPLGFEIISIGLDNPKTLSEWKHQTSQMPWEHVWDKHRIITKNYNINTQVLPQTFLLDKSGKIIAKNIRGAKISKKLEELMQKNN